MASRTVDVVATAGPSSDPYAPGATAWALAGALARRGDSVAVLFPSGGESAAAPDGVRPVPVDLPLRHPGAAIEGAELATAAGRHLRRDADLVIRDPIGLGRLGPARGRGPIVAGFVRGVELTAYDHERPPGSAGFRDRLDRWRDRRAIRRLEEAALREADRLFCDAPGLPGVLAAMYGVAESRCRTALPPVARLPDLPRPEDARASFRIPNDVPVVAAPASFEAPDPSGADRAREAFRRVRSFFPGARLIVTGTSVPADPHVTVAPERDAGTLARALAAADVTVFARRVPGFDPGVILALRAGRAVLVGPGVQFPVDPGDAVRRVADDDPGELASALAELLADPATRRPLATAGVGYASPYDPDRVLAGISDALRPIGAPALPA
jgi:glycosyltransferase involved in cell wall biosynthesis